MIINITEFVDYNEEMFLQFICIHNEQACQIIIPKNSSLEDACLLLSDYLRAAYIGELLMPHAQDFGYTNPDPTLKGSFLFEIRRFSFEQVARVLAHVVNGYDEMDFEAFIEFEICASNFIANKPDDEFACPHYIVLINQFSGDCNY